MVFDSLMMSLSSTCELTGFKVKVTGKHELAAEPVDFVAGAI